MGLAIIPFSLSNVTEAVFQAQQRMHLIAASTVPIYILRLLFMLLTIHRGINHLTSTIVISECLVLIIEWILLTRTIKPIWKIKPDFMWRTLRESRTFFAIEGAAIINDRLQLLILSVFGNELLVGLYGSIAQLMQPLSIVGNSITLAIFPEMSKTIELGSDKQRQLTESILEILLCISLPFMVGIFYFGEDLLTFIYGKSRFHEAAIALSFTALTLPLFPFSRVLSYVLVANGLEKVNLIEVISTTLFGGLTGILLIPKYQLLGAVAVDLTMMLVSFSLYTFTVYKNLFLINPLKVFYHPVLISILIALECYMLKQININFPSILVITISSYFVIIGLLGVHIFGGYRALTERFLIKK
jgi:O-antigen/teichoic acid export membrane protein